MTVYQEHPPEPRHASFVRCFWTLTASTDRSPAPLDLPIPPDKVVPDGLPELVINCADPFEEVDGAGAARRQPDLLVAGQLTTPLWIRPTRSVDLIGIRFHPTAIHNAWGISTHELNNQRVDLRDLCPSWVDDLRSVADLDRSERLSALTPLIDRWVESARFDRPNWVTHGVQLIEAGGSQLRISELPSLLGVTERKLQRTFRREVGVSAKLYARILRFQRAYHEIEVDPTQSVQVALECGYFDQSHLIRDFKQFAGRSPLAADETETLARLFSGG